MLPQSLRATQFVEGTPLGELPDDMELTSKQAAPYCGVKSGTLDKWRPLGRGPAYVKVGYGRKPRVRYRVADLKIWLKHYPRERIDPLGSEETPARVA